MSSELLSSSEIEERLASRPLWKLRSGKLYRHFQAKNFHEAMNYLISVGKISDEFHHHPDIHLTEYKTIEVPSFFPSFFHTFTFLLFLSVLLIGFTTSLTTHFHSFFLPFPPSYSTLSSLPSFSHQLILFLSPHSHFTLSLLPSFFSSFFSDQPILILLIYFTQSLSLHTFILLNFYVL